MQQRDVVHDVRALRTTAVPTHASRNNGTIHVRDGACFHCVHGCSSRHREVVRPCLRTVVTERSVVSLRNSARGIARKRKSIPRTSARWWIAHVGHSRRTHHASIGTGSRTRRSSRTTVVERVGTSEHERASAVRTISKRCVAAWINRTHATTSHAHRTFASHRARLDAFGAHPIAYVHVVDASGRSDRSTAVVSIRIVEAWIDHVGTTHVGSTRAIEATIGTHIDALCALRSTTIQIGSAHRRANGASAIVSIGIVETWIHCVTRTGRHRPAIDAVIHARHRHRCATVDTGAKQHRIAKRSIR